MNTRATPPSGSLFCGWLRAPSVLMCGDQDWDVIGQGTANRICGAGLTYNEQQRSFVFNFGGQNFTISKKIKPQLKNWTIKIKASTKSILITDSSVYFFQ